MTARKQPDVWVEIVTRAYPSGAQTTYRHSTKAMAFPTLIEGRIKKGSYAVIERALSDWRGNLEAAVFGWEEEDSDGFGRELAAELGVTQYAHPEVAVKLLSKTGRKSGLTPRIVQRGYLSRVPQGAPNRKAKYESVDALGSKFFRFNPEGPIQSQFITRTHLGPAGLFDTPADKIGKPYNIIIGEHSDLGAATKCGTSGVKGMVPVDYIGKCIYPLGTAAGSLVPANVPPPVLAAGTVVGAGGPNTYYYAVTLILPDGSETAMSNIVTVTGCPTVTDLSILNYVRLTWSPPSGWASAYAAFVAAGCNFRVLGRSNNPPTTYLDLAFTTVVGGGFYNDGGHDGSRTDVDIEKPWTPAGNGCGTTTVLTDGTSYVASANAFGVLVVGLGAMTLLNVYGSDISNGGSSARVYIDPNDPNVITPLSAAWPHSTPYVDVNGVRLTLFYARGAILDQHISGTVTFAVTTCGVEDVGDGTGTPISEAANGLMWLLNEIVLNHYATGAYGTLASYADGTSIIKTTDFAAMQAATVGFIGGRGYQMHLALTEKVTLSEVVQWWCQTFTAHVGVEQHGQITCHVIDTTANPATARHFGEKVELYSFLPEAQVAEDEVENRALFKCDWDPDVQDYRTEILKVEDIDSQAMYGLADVEDGFLGLRCTRDLTTARHAMGRRIRLNRVAPVYQEFPMGLIGMEQNLGNLIRVTHRDGLGVNGYQNEPFFIVRQKLDPNAPQERAALVGRYVGRSLVHPVAGIVSVARVGVVDTGVSILPVLTIADTHGIGIADVATVVISGAVTSAAASTSQIQLGEVATLVITTP